jgi:hypothetical protein
MFIHQAKLSYKIKFLDTPVLEGTPPEDGANVVRMVTDDQMAYDCTLPQPPVDPADDKVGVRTAPSNPIP